MTADPPTVADVAYAALLEAGRPDLAELVAFHVDDDGTLYLEPLDDVAGADLELMLKAEGLALEWQSSADVIADLEELHTAALERERRP